MSACMAAGFSSCLGHTPCFSNGSFDRADLGANKFVIFFIDLVRYFFGKIPYKFEKIGKTVTKIEKSRWKNEIFLKNSKISVVSNPLKIWKDSKPLEIRKQAGKIKSGAKNLKKKSQKSEEKTLLQNIVIFKKNRLKPLKIWKKAGKYWKNLRTQKKI